MGEVDGDLKLPVVIGSYEAQSIALVIEGLKPQRPLTHDLLYDLIEKYEIVLKEVIIDNLIEGVFFAKLITERDGVHFEIDSRTSDAIALALRANCPIYTYKNILDDAGIIYEKEVSEPDAPQHKKELKPKASKNDLSSLSLDQLNLELEKAIQVEDYDRAALIRDEINKRG